MRTNTNEKAKKKKQEKEKHLKAGKSDAENRKKVFATIHMSRKFIEFFLLLHVHIFLPMSLMLYLSRIKCRSFSAKRIQWEDSRKNETELPFTMCRMLVTKMSPDVKMREPEHFSALYAFARANFIGNHGVCVCVPKVYLLFENAILLDSIKDEQGVNRILIEVNAEFIEMYPTDANWISLWKCLTNTKFIDRSDFRKSLYYNKMQTTAFYIACALTLKLKPYTF